MRPLAMAIGLAALSAPAGADGLDLTPAQRAAFGAEIRGLLLDEPEIVARALRGPDPYAEEIRSDLDLIAAHADRLFTSDILLGRTGPVAFAVFAPPDSRLRDRLEDYATARELRIALHDPDADAALMQALTLDTIPSYVFPTLMVRGDVPPIVLDRYQE